MSNSRPPQESRTVAAIASTVSVTDHALLRYLERVLGIDVEKARAEIVEITGVAAALGAESKAHDDHIYIIDQYQVQTVLPKGGKLNKRTLSRAPYEIPRNGSTA